MSSNVTSPSGGVTVHCDDDAPPVVRLVARTLRDAARDPELVSVLGRIKGRVSLRSHNTPQRATIDFGGREVAVLAGAVGPDELSLTVDLDDRFGVEGIDEAHHTLGDQVLAVLRPRLPDWRQAAETFWASTRNLPGMPAQLICICKSADSCQEITLGSGDSRYSIAGSAESLARVFSGADDLLTKELAGSVEVRGTLPQLSVMTGASWKVRYDV